MRDYTVGDTFDVKFTTRQFTTGAPFTLAGSPVISAYPDNSTTELTAGITLTVDFDSRTGLNNVRVVATVGNGYAAGSTYALVITTGTVNSVSVVGEVVGEFTLGRSAAFGRLGAPAGASVSADVAAVKVDTAAVKVKTDFLPSATAGAAGGVFIAGTNAATAVTTALTTTFTGNLTGSVASVTGAVGSVTGLTAATVHSDLDDIQARLPAALVSGRIDASVGAMAANVVTAAAAASDLTIELQAGLATAAALSTAQADLTTIVSAIDPTGAADLDSLLALLATRAEPGQGSPAATASFMAKVDYLYKAWRNRHTQTATTYSLYADNATTVDQKATVNDDGTTFDRSEAISGP